LKQGKPASYDIELAEWLIIKLTGVNFFSPRQVQPLKVPWLDDSPEKKSKGKVQDSHESSSNAEVR
jgi:hypothetical protein